MLSSSLIRKKLFSLFSIIGFLIAHRCMASIKLVPTIISFPSTMMDQMILVDSTFILSDEKYGSVKLGEEKYPIDQKFEKLEENFFGISHLSRPSFKQPINRARISSLEDLREKELFLKVDNMGSMNSIYSFIIG